MMIEVFALEKEFYPRHADRPDGEKQFFIRHYTKGTNKSGSPAVDGRHAYNLQGKCCYCLLVILSDFRRAVQQLYPGVPGVVASWPWTPDVMTH